MSVTIPAEVLEGLRTRPPVPDTDPEKEDSEAAPAATPGWTTILFEDLEGSFPADNGWTTYDTDVDSGEDYWDDLSCRSYGGSWSAWSADIGDQTDCVQYDNDMRAWMIYGPFSLADASDARAEFRVWSETEGPDVPYDYLFWGASSNGSDFHGYRLTSNVDWALGELDLTDVPTLGDLTGDDSVWLAFLFVSDYVVNSYEGTYLDDILIEKLVSGVVDLTATDVYFRTQPANGGSIVTDPTPSDTLYPHFEFDVDSSADLTGKIWSIEINGTPLCSFTTTVCTGSWAGWCTSPISLQPGLHSLHGELDPDGSFTETNENDNDAFRNYTVGDPSGEPDIRVQPLILDFDSPAPAATTDGEEAYRLHLQRGSFIPRRGMPGALASSAAARHLLVQFDEPVDAEALGRLESLNVKALQRVPRRAVVARVPAGVDPSALPGVRWVGALRPEQKLSLRVEDAGYDGFAVVDFFPDVGAGRISEILAAAGARDLRNPYLLPGSRLLAADRQDVFALAGFDEVSWIRVASPAEVSGVEIFHCPGALTELGPVASFVTHDDGWDGPGQGSAHDLRFHFDNGTGDISGSLEEAEVARAFGEWAEHAAVTYTETTTSGLSRSMDVAWVTGSHGDGSPFDGTGGVLAHNFYPAPPNSEPIGGDMHLDDAETWRIGAGSSGFDLFTVALHEAGHGLGLGHSNDPGAVMFPSVSSSTVFSQLAADDIAGILAIYAPAATGGTGSFTIFNDGTETLNVSSIGLDSSASWISWSPDAPFSVAPGGSVGIDVTVSFAIAPDGESTRRLLVASNDPDESPYPGGVYVVVDNGQTCGAGTQDLILESGSVTSTEVHEACSSITAGPSYVVYGPNGHAILSAPTVVLRDGFSVGAGGSLTVETVVP